MIHHRILDSRAAGDVVEVGILTPPGWTGAGGLPILVWLHGAMSSAASIDLHAPLFEELWSAGRLPPVVVGCASTPTQGGFYIDWPGGPSWETLVADELPAFLAADFGGDPDRVVVAGGSMGGYGALKLAFRHPERYVAATAVAPAVFPGESRSEVPERNRMSVLGDLLEALDALPDDDVYARPRRNIDAIRSHGPALFVGVGELDEFHLVDGAEHLHRLLVEQSVSHQYLVWRNGDHMGSGMVALQRASLEFIGAALLTPTEPDG